MKNIIETLTERKQKLISISNSNDPIDPKLHSSHCERVQKAAAYAAELDSLIKVVSETATINIVPLNIFEKRISQADYAEIQDEGLFFQMALVQNFPSFEKVTLLYLTPLSDI